MKESLKQLKKALEEKNLSRTLASLKDAAALGHISRETAQHLFELVRVEQYEDAIDLLDRLDTPHDFPNAPSAGVYFNGTAA